MEFAERKVKLKDGRAAVLRAPRIEDAAALIEYLRTVAGEKRFLTQYPDEVRFTLEQEEEFLRGRIDDPRGAMIVATVDGEHAGNSSFMGVGGGRRWAHRCSVGIALYESLGFVSCGCRPRDMKYDDGTYADMRIMTREL